MQEACVFPLMSHTLNISARETCHLLDMFFCNDSWECIHKSSVCDGYDHCRYGEDEAPPSCTTDACHKLDMVFCNVSRKCIHKDWICDGDNDCRNGEDEAASACSKSSLSNIMS
ncbi:LRP8-like protein [Mya arenaria]|uniref:LRP8-like protein n=1 Tax=Mya arenaria TaxID=6604 RepID=A0ABY7ENI4_MYAAR|nr:LRP8-like protein [Mya arenaria]